MYRRGDVGQVARALRVLDALRGYKQGRSLAELAAEVDVSERTVRRDLIDLIDADVHVELTRVDGHAGAVLVDENHARVVITRRERYTLLAVRRIFDVLAGTPFTQDIEQVLRKLEQRMTDVERAEHIAFGERFAYIPDGGTKQYDDKEDVLDGLLTGVLMRKLVRFKYRGARGRAQQGILAPYAMILYKHGLYVIGARVRDGVVTDKPNNFAVERFTDAEFVPHSSFTPPPDFKLADYVQGAFGVHVGDPADAKQVVVEFSKDRAAYARNRIWHKTQQLDELPDGRVRLTFTCTNLTPVVSWVLEWGPHVKVIKPAELIETVVDELDGARAQYA